MEIVYCFTGKLPSYIVETIFQVRLFFKGKVTLLTDDIQSPHLEKLQKYTVNLVNVNEIQHIEFQKTLQENMEKFYIANQLGDRKHLFICCFQRFFLLENYMKQYSVSNVLFLELDVLIYKNPEELLPIFQQRDFTVSYVREGALCSGYFYVKNSTILQEINSFFLEFIRKGSGRHNESINEMYALYDWVRMSNNKERVWLLPGLWKDTKYPSDVWGSFDSFRNVLFDGAGIAIRVDGPDQCHRQEWERRGKVWWGTQVQYNEYEYEWKIIEGKRVLFLLNEERKSFPVYCLHIHNKNLSVFLSQPINYESMPLLTRDTFIHGNRFLHMADLVLRSKQRDHYYEVENWNPIKCLYFEDIPSTWKNPRLLYCDTDDLCFLIPILSHIQNKFVLITHNSDKNVTSNYVELANHPKLEHWFTQNLCEDLPNVSSLPIGIANPSWSWLHGNPSFFETLQKNTIDKKNTVYANFRIHTNPLLREACANTLKEKGIQITPETHPLQNLVNTASSYFTICPEGNGKDTHRFWESLLCKTIPVVLRSPMTERFKQEGYPCILLDSWQDIKPDIFQYDPTIFSADLGYKLGFAYYEQKIRKSLESLQ